jgi:hemoglobin
MAAPREDDLIGPIFATAVKDWEHHIGQIADFWSSSVLQTGRYGGRPMRPHLMLPLKAEHFDRWLVLFERTANEIFSAVVAVIFTARARRIAGRRDRCCRLTVGKIALIGCGSLLLLPVRCRSITRTIALPESSGEPE